METQNQTDCISGYGCETTTPWSWLKKFFFSFTTFKKLRFKKTANIWLFFYGVNLRQILFLKYFCNQYYGERSRHKLLNVDFIVAKQRLDWLMDNQSMYLVSKFDLGHRFGVFKWIDDKLDIKIRLSLRVNKPKY